MKVCPLPLPASGLLLGTVLLSGCSSITGLDGSSQYACKAPEGVKCDSVSGNYYNAIQNNLPSQRKPSGPASPTRLRDAQDTTAVHVASRMNGGAIPTAINTATSVAAPAEGSVYLAAPLRASPRVLRLWIKPWEDSDRDLNGESLVYVQVDNGRWLVDHVQRQAREPYAPVRPTRLPTSAGKGASPHVQESVARPAQQQSQSNTDEGSSITQALRSLQGRPAGSSDN